MRPDSICCSEHSPPGALSGARFKLERSAMAAPGISFRLAGPAKRRSAVELPSAEAIDFLLELEPAVYIDTVSGNCGLLELPYSVDLLRQYWNRPVIDPAQVSALNADLACEPRANGFPRLREMTVRDPAATLDASSARPMRRGSPSTCTPSTTAQSAHRSMHWPRRAGTTPRAILAIRSPISSSSSRADFARFKELEVLANFQLLWAERDA